MADAEVMALLRKILSAVCKHHTYEFKDLEDHFGLVRRANVCKDCGTLIGYHS